MSYSHYCREAARSPWFCSELRPMDDDDLGEMSHNDRRKLDCSATLEGQGEEGSREAFRFLDLARELRDRIYAKCLVSPDMVDLRNLLEPREQRPDHRFHGIYPSLLLVCRQIETEAKEVLYGLNTFCVTTHTMWSTENEDELDVSCVCPICTPPFKAWASRRLHDDAVLGFPNIFSFSRTGNPVEYRLPWMDVPIRPREYNARWGKSIGYVRRLHVSLQAPTFHQYALYQLLCNDRIQEHGDEMVTPVRACRHQLQKALPPSLALHLLILHIGKPALASPQHAVMSIDSLTPFWHQYPYFAGPWRHRIEFDLRKEKGWLLQYAARFAKHVVIPTKGAAAPGDAANRLKQYFLTNDQTVSETIPSWAFGAGQISYLRPSGQLRRAKNALAECKSPSPVRRTGATTEHPDYLHLSRLLIQDSIADG